MREHWPGISIFVRGDSDIAGPEMYDYCETEDRFYAFGYSTNIANGSRPNASRANYGRRTEKSVLLKRIAVLR
jgi:hypothetical protein